MHHPEAAIAGLFDHEHDLAPRDERDAPDWGGDELFSSTPRRRFRGERPRRRETADHAVALAAPRQAPARRNVAPTPTPERGEVDHSPRPRSADLIAAPPERDASGRRTVTITGHPERTGARSLDVARRRPAPTVDQRVGSRPDRIAGWAFALGMLLILIAYATAQAGT